MARKDILEEAMEDAKLLKQTAIENAKNVLVEAMSPKIKKFVESQLGGGPLGMGGPGQVSPQVEAGMYEKEEKEDAAEEMDLLKRLGLLDNEGMSGMESYVSEGEAEEDEGESESEQNEDEDEDESKDEDDEDMEESLMGMGMHEAEKKEDENGEEEEVVEIANSDLRAALSEVLGDLKLEAQVSKGFADAADVDDGGLADEKSGEHHWKDEEAPASQDWTVKEAAYRKKIVALARQNETLQNENKEYKNALGTLRRNLQEVNLFNSRLLYANKLLNGSQLNSKQRLGIIEAFDRAQSMREVELVYKSLSESLKIAGVLMSEVKKQGSRTVKGPKSSRFTTPSSTILKEAMSKEANEDNGYSRMQELAGLLT
jgi:hypothetical protein